MNIFEQNENHECKIKTRNVKFSNDNEIDSSKINFSDKNILKETIKEIKDMNILSRYTY